MSKKDVLLRCYQNKYKVTVETPRIVASDYSFAQIVERLRQAEFEAKENCAEIALKAEINSQNRPVRKKVESVIIVAKLGTSGQNVKRENLTK